MPTITSALIPTKAPGSLFSNLTGGDASLNIRWLTAQDPCFYEVLNRPLADIAVRQLVIAKTVDILNIRLGHQALFPFIVQPTVNVDTHFVDFPIGMIWDIHVTAPIKWENIRLAKIERISGSNGVTYDEYNGMIRLVFSGNVVNGTAETLLFYADYHIDSVLTYQRVPVTPATITAVKANNVISLSESPTVGGYMIFKTLDVNLQSTREFLDAIAPPIGEMLSGLFQVPAIYEITDSIGGNSNFTEDYDLSPIMHGTGLLTDSAYNAIPPLNTDVQTWINAFNYPFDADANMEGDISDTEGGRFNVPIGMFREFNVTAPASDGPSPANDTRTYAVELTRIIKLFPNDANSPLRFYFSCRDVTIDSTFSVIKEFATLDLPISGRPGDIIHILPIDTTNTDTQNGVGYVILSSIWDGTSPSIEKFFRVFIANPFSDKSVKYNGIRISSFGVSRTSRYSPTKGQALALTGTASNRSTPIPPSADNKYVTEADRGIGDRIDLEATFTQNSAIERYGYTGCIANRVVKLVVDSTQVPNDPTFYDTVILPRLTALLGRPPEFADGWFNGTRFLTWNGDSWQG
jgi:hypothetical protein